MVHRDIALHRALPEAANLTLVKWNEIFHKSAFRKAGFESYCKSTFLDVARYLQRPKSTPKLDHAEADFGNTMPPKAR
jgi:hypothetical protein